MLRKRAKLFGKSIEDHTEPEIDTDVEWGPVSIISDGVCKRDHEIENYQRCH